MAIRRLYLARHGEADAFGALTGTGREQARLLGRRLAQVPVTAIWHSPLPRAADSARELDTLLNGAAPVREAGELVDHVPYVPPAAEMPESLRAFFDGYDADEAAAGRRVADRMVARFATTPDSEQDVHEVLITHAYPIAWLVRDALGAPPARWIGVESANMALSVLEYRPGLAPTLVMFNDMSHLPTALRWTGFAPALRP